MFDEMKKFDDEIKAKQYPERVCIVNRAWFDKWKERVNYAKYEYEMMQAEKPRIFKSVNLQASSQPVIDTSPKPFFGNWGNNNLIKSNTNSLGARIEEERKFNEAKQKKVTELEPIFESGDQSGQDQPPQSTLSSETLFSDDFVNQLGSLGPINNFDICRPFDSYIRDEDEHDQLQNLALKDGFSLHTDGPLVPTSVGEQLAAWYGCDQILYRDKNPFSEAWSTYLMQKYTIQFEEVRLLIMIPDQPEQCVIEVLNSKGENVKKIAPALPANMQAPVAPPVPNGSVVPLPPAPSIPLPPPPTSFLPPPVPQYLPPVPPVPTSTLPPVPTSTLPPTPPPVPSSASQPLTTPKSFTFHLQHQSVFICKSETIDQIKSRISKYLKIDTTRLRIWRHESRWSE